MASSPAASATGFERRAWLAALCCLLVGACGVPNPAREEGELARASSAGFDPPAAAGAFAPNLATVEGDLAATWLEPTVLPDGADGHRLRFARLDGEVWSEPVSIAEGGDFFANWADFPELVEAGDGALYAHWLAKTAPDTYAYSVFLARSGDGGATWEPYGKLNSDDTPTEHGFVSLLAEEKGARAVWLDGRAMVEGGPMALRTARVDERERTEKVLDPRVCECCGTDAVVSSDGPVIVYRDRSEAEVRDVLSVRRAGPGWSPPAPVHADGWRIEGCPVNGPALDAAGAVVATAWFTAGSGTGRVQVAFSDDSGATFGEPIVLETTSDDAVVLGRVDIALTDDGTARVSWVTQVGERAAIRLRSVSRDGVMGDERLIAETSPARASGFPILQFVDQRLFSAWVEIGEGRLASRVRIDRL